MPFKRGESGNPSGRNRNTVMVERDGVEVAMTIAELAREHTAEALGALADICGDEKAPKPARVSAAVALLDRGWGRPKQELELSGPDGGPIETADLGDLAKLTTDELRQLETIRGKLGSGDPAAA